MVHIPEACLLLIGALRQRFTVELHYTQEHGFAGELCGSKKHKQGNLFKVGMVRRQSKNTIQGAFL